MVHEPSCGCPVNTLSIETTQVKQKPRIFAAEDYFLRPLQTTNLPDFVGADPFVVLKTSSSGGETRTAGYLFISMTVSHRKAENPVKRSDPLPAAAIGGRTHSRPIQERIGVGLALAHSREIRAIARTFITYRDPR